MFTILMVTFGFLILIKLLVNYTFWTRNGIPNRPYPSFAWMFQTLDEFLLGIREYHNGAKISGGYVLMSKILTVNDAQVARDLSVKELHKFPIRFNSYIGDNSLSKSLFFMEVNEDYKRVRKIISPAFTSGKLKAMMESIGTIGDQLIENLRKVVRKDPGIYFDIKPHIDGFTMDVISSCAYGVHLNSINEPNHPIIQNAKRILNTNISFRQAVCIFSPPLAKLFKLNFFDNKAVEYFDQLTKTIIERRKESQTTYNDLIGLMMKEFEKGEDGISLNEIAAQSVLFFIAGYDTTNAAFDHILYYLSRNPEWQEKLYEEVKNSDFEHDKVTEFPVLNAIIYETLRLKPSLILFERNCIEDTYLLDTGIPITKGTTISIHPYIIHRDPEYFELPDKFMPQRFINTGLENSFAYMPFGAGNRLCVGMRFALQELRIGVSKFFKHFTVNIPPDFEPEYFKGSVLLSPKRLLVSLSERKSL